MGGLGAKTKGGAFKILGFVAAPVGMAIGFGIPVQFVKGNGDAAFAALTNGDAEPLLSLIMAGAERGLNALQTAGATLLA